MDERMSSQAFIGSMVRYTEYNRGRYQVTRAGLLVPYDYVLFDRNLRCKQFLPGCVDLYDEV